MIILKSPFDFLDGEGTTIRGARYPSMQVTPKWRRSGVITTLCACWDFL